MQKSAKRIGVFALQGSFAEHVAMMRQLGQEVHEIRTMSDIKKVDPQAIILPGGESTTMMGFLRNDERLRWINGAVKAGMPTLATCAGLILLSKSHLNLIEIEVDRNAYGSQLDSFEKEIPISVIGKKPFNAICIRAPKIKKIGPGVSMLAEIEPGNPGLIQQSNILGVTFHPELTEDTRIHEYFIDLI